MLAFGFPGRLRRGQRRRGESWDRGGGLMGCGAGRGVCILLVRVGCGKVQTTWVRSSARSRRLGACDAGVN